MDRAFILSQAHAKQLDLLARLGSLDPETKIPVQEVY